MSDPPSLGPIARLLASGRPHVVGAYVVVNLCAAITGILMARAVGSGEYGAYAVLASQVALLGVVVQLGTPLHILRSEGDGGVIEAASVALRLVSVLGTLVALFAITVLSLPVMAGIAVLLLPAAAVTNSFVPRLRGPRLAASAQAMGAVALMVMVAALFIVDQLNAERLIVLSAAAALLVPFLLPAIRQSWAMAMTAPRPASYRRHLRSSLVLMVGNSLSSAALVSLPLVAALRLDHEHVGFLRASLSVSALLGGLVNLLTTQQFLPQLVSLRGLPAVRAKIWRAAREQLVFLLLLSIGFIVAVVTAGEWFVRRTFGDDFAPVSAVLPTAGVVEVLKAMVSVELGVLFVFGGLRQILAVESFAAVLIGVGALLSTAVFQSPRGVIAGVGCAYALVAVIAGLQLNRVLPRGTA